MKKIIIMIFISTLAVIGIFNTIDNQTAKASTIVDTVITDKPTYQINVKWEIGTDDEEFSMFAETVHTRTFTYKNQSFPLTIGFSENLSCSNSTNKVTYQSVEDFKKYGHSSIHPTLMNRSEYVCVNNVSQGGTVGRAGFYSQLAIIPNRDRTPSTISIGTDGSTTWKQSHTTSINVSDSQAGIASKQYAWSTSSSTSGLNWKTLSSTSVTTPNESGKWYLFVKATDKVGNSRTVRSNQFYVDVDEPTISFGTNDSSTWRTSHNTTITVNDSHSAIKTKQYTWSTSSTTPTSNWTNFSSNTITTPSNITSGKWYLHIKATDNVGNIKTARSNQFYIDVDKPTISFTQKGNTTYDKSHSTTVTVNDTGGSNVKTKQFKWTTTPDRPVSFDNMTSNTQTFTTPSNQTSTYYLHIKVVDSAGNETYTKSEVFNVDNKAPVITITTESITHEMGTDFNYEDYGTCMVSDERGETILCEYEGVDPFVNTEQTQTLTIIATDAVGNITLKQIPVYIVDTTPPVVEFTYSSQTQSADVSFDDIGVGCKEHRYIWTTTTLAPENWSGTPVVNNCENTTYELTQDGIWYLHIKVTDEKENTATYTSGTLERDTTPPEITVDTKTIKHEINTTFNYENYGTCTVTDNSKEQINCKYTDIDTSSLGALILTITATDSSGNQSITSINIEIVDTTKPSINISKDDITVAQGGYIENPFCEVTDNSLETINCNFSEIDTALIGIQTLIVTATDGSGNTAQVEISVTVLDTIPPVIELVTDIEYVIEGLFYLEVLSDYSQVKWLEFVTATDNFDSDLEITENAKLINFKQVGEYVVTYTAKDTAGNVASVDLMVHLVDTEAPIINVLRDRVLLDGDITAEFLNSLYSVQDNYDLNQDLKVDIDTSKIKKLISGTYDLDITVTDTSGNSSNATIKIVVEAEQDYAMYGLVAGGVGVGLIGLGLLYKRFMS